jgi:hypothetical protein
MRRIRIASSSILVLACVFLTLFLHAPAGAATRSKAPGDLIRIWIVGSPHTGALPPPVVSPGLKQRTEKLGYTIEVESFRASGFAVTFRQALQDHTEPEILTFDNFGVIRGIQTRLGWFEGIDSDRQVAPSLAMVHETMTSLQARGWVMLVRSAVNYEAARALSMQPAECEASETIDPALLQAQEKAVSATRAYLACDRSTLSEISDESRLVQQCMLPQSDTKVESVKVCRISGNDKLAFFSLIGGFSAETHDANTIFQVRHGMDLGQHSILAVLKNQSGTWRLLAITHDPLNTWAEIPLTTANTFVNLLDHGAPTGITPEPGRPLTPDGVYPRPRRGERFGDFIWEPSQNTDVIGQVVEFTWGKGTNWGLTRLFFLPAKENKVSSGHLMSGGIQAWRVWTVSKSGDVAFSEQHSFVH